MTLSDIRPYLSDSFKLDLSMLVTYAPVLGIMRIPVENYDESGSP